MALARRVPFILFAGSRYGGGREAEETGLQGASGFGHTTSGESARGHGAWHGRGFAYKCAQCLLNALRGWPDGQLRRS